jgi:hypothetical protein
MNDELFWSHVDQSAGPDGCWPYMLSRDSDGYGILGRGTVSKGTKVTLKAHRYALTLAGRPLLPGEHACHRCDNPPCCNPGHLFAGSSADNNADMMAKGRGPIGSRNGQALLEEEQIIKIREDVAVGNKLADVGMRYGITKSTVSVIARGERWLHIGGPITRRPSTRKKETV